LLKDLLKHWHEQESLRAEQYGSSATPKEASSQGQEEKGQ
jgi:hypothetical protein